MKFHICRTSDHDGELQPHPLAIIERPYNEDTGESAIWSIDIDPADAIKMASDQKILIMPNKLASQLDYGTHELSDKFVATIEIYDSYRE